MVKLENGMFGVMENQGNFVVVNDYIVYENGGWDEVNRFNNDDLSGSFYRVNLLVTNCCCFSELRGYITDEVNTYDIECVYDRSGKRTVVEMTIAEIEKKLGIKNLKIVK